MVGFSCEIEYSSHKQKNESEAHLNQHNERANNLNNSDQATSRWAAYDFLVLLFTLSSPEECHASSNDQQPNDTEDEVLHGDSFRKSCLGKL